MRVWEKGVKSAAASSKLFFSPFFPDETLLSSSLPRSLLRAHNEDDENEFVLFTDCAHLTQMLVVNELPHMADCAQ